MARIISGSPVTLTTAPAQYLFRVYHRPITSCAVDSFKVRPLAKGYNNDLKYTGFELNYNDHLFSLPPTEENLADTANRIAYSESLLYVNDEIYFVCVWLVETGKSIDQQTPVAVYHPFYSQESKVWFEGWINERVTRTRGYADNNTPIYGDVLYSGSTYGFFKTFDLCLGDPETNIYDPFIVLDVARNTTKGRSRHEWYYNCLGVNDYRQDVKGQFYLTNFGVAKNQRFQWFQATLEAMEFTHSGYAINQNGSIFLDREAVTKRIANGAVNAAQRRRMFVLRNPTVEKVWQKWHETVNTVSKLLHIQDISAWPRLVSIPIANQPGDAVEFMECDARWIYQIALHVKEFVNYIAIWSGDDGFPIVLPNEDKAKLALLFSSFFTDGFGNSASFEPVTIYHSDEHEEINIALIDLTWKILDACLSYFEKVDPRVPYSPVAGGYYLYPGAAAIAKPRNDFAAIYEELQGDCIALQALLFSWQFTFHPVEQTRNPAGVDDLKTGAWNGLQNWSNGLHYVAADDPPHEAARLNERLMGIVPIMASNRLWGVVIPPDTARAAYDRQQLLDEIAAAAAARQRIKDEREAQRSAKVAEKRADLAAQQAELTANPSGANVTDIYDWRNWSNRKWWTRQFSNEEAVHFVINALDTPKLSNYAQDVFHASPRVVRTIKRIEPLIYAVKDVIIPIQGIKNVAGKIILKRIAKRAGVRYAKREVKEVSRGVVSHVTEVVSGSAPVYEPRQIWPS